MEGSATMRAVCREKLESQGFWCETAASAKEAEKAINTALDDHRPFDGMLLDSILPDMDGIEFMKKIAGDSRFSDLAVMILTEHPDKEIWQIMANRVNCEIQLKEKIDFLPTRMGKFIELHCGEQRVHRQFFEFSKELGEGKNEKILLVDDSATVIAKYKMLLEGAGYNVVTAMGFNEGLAVARREQPCLAILDYFMPDGNGDELCQKLLEDPLVPNIVAVVMFSQKKEIVESALKAGAIDLICKDDPVHIFLMRIASILQVIRAHHERGRLDILTKVTNALGVGIMLQSKDSMTPLNLLMQEFMGICPALANRILSQKDKTILKLVCRNGRHLNFKINQIKIAADYYAILVQDITDRLKWEDDLKKANKKAEQANRAKSEFLANMSHELRSPLNSILLLSKYLAENKENKLTEKMVECASTIYTSGGELLNLVNGLLDLAKAESGKMSVVPEKTGIREIAGVMEKNFKPVAENNGVKFDIHIAENVPETIFTDFQRLSQILTNLLSNSFKFTLGGSVSLEICCRNSVLPVTFMVKDTGTGIAPEQLETIFEAFKQADGSTSRKYGGTGLGLSISRELTALLGGTLEVSSILDRGSVFTLSLPERIPGNY